MNCATLHEPAACGQPRAVTLKVLSVQQPWADGLCLGWKPVENRSWSTSYRGRLWIHASKPARKPNHDRLSAQAGQDFADLVHGFWDLPGSRKTGAIIGSVDIVDIVPWDWVDDLAYLSDRTKESELISRAVANWQKDGATTQRMDRLWKVAKPWADRHPDGHSAMLGGPIVWIVENPVLLRNPIPCGGKLNLWNFQADAIPE